MNTDIRRFGRIGTLAIACSAAAGAFAAPVRAAEPILKSGDTLALCGDSITELKGYSAFLEDYLLMCKPVGDVRAIQFGWGGSSAWHVIYSKFNDDILRFKPTVATICFGMNDGGYRAFDPEVGEKHRASTQKIIDSFKAGGVRTIVLASPGVVDADTYKKDPAAAKTYNATLAALRDIDRELAAKNGLVFVDMHTLMMDVMTRVKADYGPTYHFAGADGIHPGPNGHLVMAYAFLKAFGFDGNIGTVAVDLKTGQASATDGHKLLSETLKNDALEIESTRYPFCFTGKPDQPMATTGVIAYIPFNQELNRLTLIVRNAPAGGAKITWGSVSKDFTAEELAAGINLAAEFLQNPFVAQFQKVHAAVVAQQTFENEFIRHYVSKLATFKSYAADEDGPVFDRTLAHGMKKAKALQDTAAALVIPIRHTLKIEPAK